MGSRVKPRIGLGRREAGGRVSLWKDFKANKELYVLAAPFMILFFVFTVVPILMSVFLSFTYYNMLEAPEWRGFMNYARLFLDDDVFIIALKNTLLFAVITGPLSYIMCFLFAWFINELTPKLRSVVTLVFYAPAITSNVYFIWQFLFSSDQYGFINSQLMQLGLINEPVKWLTDQRYMLGVIMLVQLWMSLGTSFLAFIAGLQSVDKSLYEAASIDGIRNRWQELWYVTLPTMKPQLLFGAVMQISAAFSVGTISQMLAGFPSKGYAAHTIVLHIMDYGNIRYEMGYASAIAVVLFLMMAVIRKVVERAINYIGS